mgnify:CR=1 FL=1
MTAMGVQAWTKASYAKAMVLQAALAMAKGL